MLLKLCKCIPSVAIKVFLRNFNLLDIILEFFCRYFPENLRSFVYAAGKVSVSQSHQLNTDTKGAKSSFHFTKWCPYCHKEVKIVWSLTSSVRNREKSAMTTAQVVETSVTLNNNSPIQDYVHPDDQTQAIFEMTPGFKPFTERSP